MNQDLRNGKNGFKSMGGGFIVQQKEKLFFSDGREIRRTRIEVSLKVKFDHKKHMDGLEPEKQKTVNNLEENAQGTI